MLAFLLAVKLVRVLLLGLGLYAAAVIINNYQLPSFRSKDLFYIIFCCVTSLMAGGIVNQLYDAEVDKKLRPIRFYIQNFLKISRFLYLYIFLNLISLVFALICSPKLFILIVFFQVMLWYYSHKKPSNKIQRLLLYCLLTIFPFFILCYWYSVTSWGVFFLGFHLTTMLYGIHYLKENLVDYKLNVVHLNKEKVFAGNILPIIFPVFSAGLCYNNVQKFLPDTLAQYLVLSLGIFLLVSILIRLNPKPKIIYFSYQILRLMIPLGIMAILLPAILKFIY